MIELSGKGCHWYVFMLDCLTVGGMMKRLDLAINDRVGILDIPTLKAKYKAGECISYFRSPKDYGGSQKCGDDIPKNTVETLYLGSTNSQLHFCIYQKNYEQYVKNGTELEDTEIKNRFEIRLKDDRAYYAVVDLLTYRDVERTPFSIINHYMRFVVNSKIYCCIIVLPQSHNQNNYYNARNYICNISPQYSREFYTFPGIGFLKIPVKSPTPFGNTKKQENQ